MRFFLSTNIPILRFAFTIDIFETYSEKKSYVDLTEEEQLSVKIPCRHLKSNFNPIFFKLGDNIRIVKLHIRSKYEPYGSQRNVHTFNQNFTSPLKVFT